MSAPLRRKSNDGDGWRDLFVLVATLFLGCFFVTSAVAVAGAAGRAEPGWQIVIGVLFVGLQYALAATILGLAPLLLYSFIYTFLMAHSRITYFGVAALAAGVVILSEMALQAFSSDGRAYYWGGALLGGLHALPTALIAHFLIKRLHRRRLGTGA